MIGDPFDDDDFPGDIPNFDYPDDRADHDRGERISAPPPNSKYRLRWHGEADPNADRAWLIRNLVFETGKGLFVGQWGAGKTFGVLDLSASAMTGEPFAGRTVARTGGVLFIAPEGAFEIPIRLRGLVEGKLRANTIARAFQGAAPVDLDNLPFAWIDECPRLVDSDATAKAFNNGLNALGLSIGSILLPSLNELTGNLLSITRGAEAFTEAHPALVGGAVKIAASLIALKVAATGAAFAMRFLKGGALTAMMGAAAAGGGAKKAGALLMAPFLLASTRLTGIFQTIALRYRLMLATMATSSVGIGAMMAAVAATGSRALLALLNPIGLVTAALKGLRLVLLGSGIGAALVAIGTAGAFIYRNFSGITKAVQSFGAAFMKALGPTATSNIKPLTDAISGVGTFFDELTAKIDDKQWQDWGASAGTAVAGMLGDLKEVATAVNSLVSGFKSLGDWFTGAGDLVANTRREIEALLKLYRDITGTGPSNRQGAPLNPGDELPGVEGSTDKPTPKPEAPVPPPPTIFPQVPRPPPVTPNAPAPEPAPEFAEMRRVPLPPKRPATGLGRPGTGKTTTATPPVRPPELAAPTLAPRTVPVPPRRPDELDERPRQEFTPPAQESQKAAPQIAPAALPAPEVPKPDLAPIREAEAAVAAYRTALEAVSSEIKAMEALELPGLTNGLEARKVELQRTVADAEARLTSLRQSAPASEVAPAAKPAETADPASAVPESQAAPAAPSASPAPASPASAPAPAADPAPAARPAEAAPPAPASTAAPAAKSADPARPAPASLPAPAAKSAPAAPPAEAAKPAPAAPPPPASEAAPAAPPPPASEPAPPAPVAEAAPPPNRLSGTRKAPMVTPKPAPAADSAPTPAPVAATPPAPAPVTDPAAVQAATAALAGYRAEAKALQADMDSLQGAELPGVTGLVSGMQSEMAALRGKITETEAALKAMGAQTVAPRADASGLAPLTTGIDAAKGKVVELDGMSASPTFSSGSLDALNGKLDSALMKVRQLKAEAASIPSPNVGGGGRTGKYKDAIAGGYFDQGMG